ncbi:hypothetical protein BMS3Bbin07_00546 [bacterium BMS3Bbin07]|nr:hypothetical protein BMS3Bbin07_00546 [bacterium BMS3Bbin07]
MYLVKGMEDHYFINPVQKLGIEGLLQLIKHVLLDLRIDVIGTVTLKS